MTRNEFLSNLQELLQREDELSFADELGALQEWDSLAKLALLAWLDREFKISVSVSEVEKFKSVGEIAALCGVE